MGVAVLASVRSCATTTLAVALAATWPAGRRVLLVELDPAGGTLAAVSGWEAEPGLVSLGAAARHRSDPEAIWAHCRQLPGGAAVLVAPAVAAQVRHATATLGGLIGRLGELDADVLVDVGRLDAATTLPALSVGAGRVLVAVRPRLADLHATSCFIEARRDDAPAGSLPVALVVVGDGPYADAEIADALGVEVLGQIPWDPEAAELLCTRPVSDRRLRLSPLVRAARSLAETLVPKHAAPEPAVPKPMAVPAAEASGGTPSHGVGLRARLLRPRPAPLVVEAGAPVAANGSTPEGGAT